MATEMTTRAAIASQVGPLPNGLTPLLSKHLGSQDLAKHKATLGLELEVLAKKFDRFGWDRDRGTAAQDRLVLDWMDALKDYPLDEVRNACKAAVLSNPNKMPNEGHVIAQIEKARAAFLAKQPKPIEAPKPERVVSDAQRETANVLTQRFARRAGMTAAGMETDDS